MGRQNTAVPPKLIGKARPTCDTDNGVQPGDAYCRFGASAPERHPARQPTGISAMFRLSATTFAAGPLLHCVYTIIEYNRNMAFVKKYGDKTS